MRPTAFTTHASVALLSALLLAGSAASVGCSTSSGDGSGAGMGGSAGSGAAGGTGGAGGSAGTLSAAGTGGSAGTAVAAGTGGSMGGSAGGSVAAGTGGSSGSGVTAGSGGSAGSGAAAGTGGAAGSGVAAGAGGASGGGGVTSLSDATVVSTLTMAQAEQLCNDTYAYFGSAIPQATACKWQGLAYAASSSAPTEEKLRQNCTDHEGSCNTAGGPMYNPSCSSIPATCTATVGEYSACIAEEVTAFGQAVSGLSTCDALTRDNAIAVSDVQSAAPAPSCASLTDKCPDLYPPNPSIN
jgi:hypothetical protein